MTAKQTITLASRKSALAMAQAQLVASALQDAGFAARVVGALSEGDQTDKPLADIGGKALFVRALQKIVKNGEAAAAVHSLKDMESSPSAGFVLAAAGFAEDARDVLISANGAKLKELPNGARVGTCSPRRAALLAEVAPNVRVVNMRGNVETRLDKMRRGECDALILAAAGLRRLGMAELITEYLPEDVFIPAPCQGLLGIECLASNKELIATLAEFGDEESTTRAETERAFSAAMSADCHTPLGARARKNINGVSVDVCYADDNGMHRARAEGLTPQAAAENAAKEIRRKRKCQNMSG